MATALKVVQRAFYEQLAGNVSVLGDIVPVYDHVPDESPYPYIAIGDEATEIPIPAHWDKQGKEVTAQVHVWSNYRGMSETHDINDAIDTQLDLQFPGVVGWTISLMRLEFRDVFREPSGLRHGVSRYRIHIHNV